MLHKVQKNLESQDVAGAEFTLSKLDSSGWTIYKNSLVTDQTGEIHFAKAATESTNSAPVEYNTLYKLVEIKAPNGYLLKENTSYFIMLQPGQAELNAYQAAIQNAVGVTPPKQEDVTFATYGKTTVLQVENSKLELTVRKVWKNADGTIMSEDQKNKQSEIKVDVFKKGDNTAFDTVTLNSANGWIAQVNLTKCKDLKSNTKFEAKEQDGNSYIISYMDGFGVEHSANDAYQSGDTIVVVNQLKPTELSVDDTEIKNDFEVKTTTTTFADGCSFEVVFSDLKTITSVKAGSKIRVEYTSTLNDKAVIGDEGNLNKAQLEYSNNPRDTNSKDKTVWDNVVVFTYQVVVNKYANSVAEDNKLTGAEFTLSKKLKDGTSKVITAVKSEEGTRFTFKGLDDGEYTLTETVTPEGYNTIDPITFNVSADHEITWDGTGNRNDLLNSLTGNEVTGEITFAKNANVNGSLVTDIINKSGTVLPSTGGMGTTVFYVVGGGLMAVAVVLLVTKKRMENKR